MDTSRVSGEDRESRINARRFRLNVEVIESGNAERPAVRWIAWLDEPLRRGRPRFGRRRVRWM